MTAKRICWVSSRNFIYGEAHGYRYSATEYLVFVRCKGICRMVSTM